MDDIAFNQFREAIRVWQVAQGILACRSVREARNSFSGIGGISARHWVIGQRRPLLSAHQYETLAVLRNAIMCGVQHVPRKAHVVSGVIEGPDKFLKESLVGT